MMYGDQWGGEGKRHTRKELEEMPRTQLDALQKGEPMTTPDQNSAAVDAIAQVLNAGGIGITRAHELARAILDHLREHPEHGLWPVMTVSEVCDLYWHHEERLIEEWIALLAGTLVIPDPPAAEPFNRESVHKMIYDAVMLAESSDMMIEAIDKVADAIVEAATKGADHE